MEAKTYKQCLDTIAQKRGFENWDNMDDYGDELFFQEAAELMCNEAVKADRKFIAKKAGMPSINKLPIPFPEIYTPQV